MIKGENINLCSLTHEDSQKILIWVNDPNLRKMMGTVFPISEIEHKIWFEEKVKKSDEKIFGIYYDDELVGVIGLKNINYLNSNAEIYMYIGEKKFRSKGIGRDALNSLINFAFEEMNLHRVQLEVFSYNKVAQSLYTKIGFTIEGILKECIYREGIYHDKLIMSLLNHKESRRVNQ